MLIPAGLFGSESFFFSSLSFLFLFLFLFFHVLFFSSALFLVGRLFNAVCDPFVSNQYFPSIICCLWLFFVFSMNSCWN